VNIPEKHLPMISRICRINYRKLATGLAVTLAAATLSGCKTEESIPQYVKGPLSGFVYECQQEGQTATDMNHYLTRHDLDGDGQPDYVLDSAKGCKANTDLYCAAEGCSISIHVSSKFGKYGMFKVKSFSFDKVGDKSVIVLNIGGPKCAERPGGLCTEKRMFNGSEFVIAPEAKQ